FDPASHSLHDHAVRRTRAVSNPAPMRKQAPARFISLTAPELAKRCLTVPARNAHMSTLTAASVTNVASSIANWTSTGSLTFTNCGTKATKKTIDLGLRAVTI